MAPDERRRELAEILAAALIRLRLRVALPNVHGGGDKPLESSPNCLDASLKTVLSVHTG
jgi:hypothetical protein